MPATGLLSTEGDFASRYPPFSDVRGAYPRCFTTRLARTADVAPIFRRRYVNGSEATIIQAVKCELPFLLEFLTPFHASRSRSRVELRGSVFRTRHRTLPRREVALCNSHRS